MTLRPTEDRLLDETLMHPHKSGDISDIDSNYLKLNQSTPQDISGGQPDFNAGLRAGSTDQLSVDASGNLLTTGTLGARAITGTNLNLTNTTNQIVMQSAGVTTTLTESGASSNKVITFPNFTGTLYISSGTDVAVADGGTAKSSWTANGVVYAAATSTLDQSANLTFASNILTVTGTVHATVKTRTPSKFTVIVPYNGTSWDNLAIPINQAPNLGSYTISRIQATAVGSSSPALEFNLNERVSTTFGTSGTNVFSATQTADEDGATLTSFANAGIAANYGVFLTTGASAQTSGTVSYLVLNVEYKLD